MGKLKKILFVIDNLDRGGRERQLLELIKGLRKEEFFDIKLLVFDDKKSYNNYNFDIIYFKRTNRLDLKLIYFSFKFILRFKPDVIHFWSFFAGLIVFFPSIIIQSKLINSTLRNTHSPPKNFLKKTFQKLLFLVAHYNVSNTKLALGINSLKPNNKNHVIYNGIDLNRFYESDKKDIDKTNVIMVGRFSQIKNHALFFNLAEAILSENKNFIFTAIGDGIYFNKYYNKYINHEGINIMSSIDNIEDLLSKMDIGLHFSFSEGTPNSILEFMASKIPVIATGPGGTKEVIINYKNGIYFEEVFPDFQILKSSFLELVSNKKLKNKLIKNAYETIENNFSFDTMISKYKQLYE